MAISFTCPNGHVLSASEEKAGRMAKCPKCHEAVRIPGGSSPSTPNASGSGTKNVPLPPGHILFLCPNGHRLNGPASLAGKAGQCPHCGAKFRIPAADESSEPESHPEEEAELTLDHDTDEHESDLELEELGEEENIDELSGEEYYEDHPAEEPSVDFGLEGVEPADTGSPASSGNNWGRLFHALWSEKSTGSEVDVYLADGTKLTPQWFSKSHSQGGQGVFAARDTEGAYTVTAVAWESVIRVDVRHVIDLPDSMFEE